VNRIANEQESTKALTAIRCQFWREMRGCLAVTAVQKKTPKQLNTGSRPQKRTAPIAGSRGRRSSRAGFGDERLRAFHVGKREPDRGVVRPGVGRRARMGRGDELAVLAKRAEARARDDRARRR
jgi:hypothetical protein